MSMMKLAHIADAILRGPPRETVASSRSGYSGVMETARMPLASLRPDH
jgi:hypothetical protein